MHGTQNIKVKVYSYDCERKMNLKASFKPKLVAYLLNGLV